ncbi:TonB-dependent receptor [Rhodoplanes sp. Z2-YC6860]|uniref:TonB-dependent receptor n=1 Tax=Rhodoplanes sp. Z2-YC6860 TaxID=674703 RepID=UPI000A057940|nr:TonB-dependent receptor [Rhodoplanes sp. Z2-YC6860]
MTLVAVAVAAAAGSDSASAQSTQLPRISVVAPKRAKPKLQRTAPKPTPPQAASANVAAPPRQMAPINTSNERLVPGAEVNAYPVTRPAEALEQAAPGLAVTQHSGEGKANQYFLRGFNLDHGTDLAITVDGMPVNMPTHGHGQGYADLNFLIPELIQSVRVRKGPYFADEGDFSSAGALHIDYLKSLDRGFWQATVGSFGYRRLLAAQSYTAGSGKLLAAFETNAYNGPWDVPDDVRKFNGLLRYSQGNADNGLSVLGMAYANKWNSTDQVAQRAIDGGVIDRWGSLNPTDGGQSSRTSLSANLTRTEGNAQTKASAYVIRQTLTLFNDFTYFLNDPVNGDQFSQTDRRTIVGGEASHTVKGRLLGFDTENTLGIQLRRDDIAVGLIKTIDRMPLSTVRQDNVGETSVGIYGQNTTRWTNWFRTVLGLRGDYFTARVNSDTPQNSGDTSDFKASPKASLIFGPFYKTEYFLSAGYGFHSNDARGATITVDPTDKTTPLQRVPLLVRSKGAEVGVRTKAIAGLESTLSVFVLDYDSEILFVGDAGTTEPSRPSRRVGVEWTNRYKVNSWLGLDVDFAYTHARFTDVDPVGNRIPGAPGIVASAGVTLGEKTGWFGSAKLRYFGPRPLIEDNSASSSPAAVVNASLGYRWDGGWRVQIDALNLFNSRSNQIEYFYDSQLRGETAPVADRHLHPLEPTAVRLTLAGPLP